MPRLALDTVERDWLGGHRASTHLSNAMHLLFPAGERFFVRSVLHYEDGLSRDLALQVKGFCRQEGRHARAHERFLENLRSQGHDVDAILQRYESIAYGTFERYASPALRLSVTAALEHFTALFAADALARGVLGDAHPEMRHLLEWHAVEELEHKAVAFDVLRSVAPGHALRVLGLAFASVGLGYFWATAARTLLAEDGVGLGATLALLGDVETSLRMDVPGMLRGLFAYLRVDFHPDDVDHEDLIAATLARLAAEGTFDPERDVATRGS